MAYNKRIRGDSNQANEEFSHNRITIVAGGAGVIAVLFAISLVVAALVFVVINFGWLISAMIILALVGASLYGASFLVERISDVHTKIRQNKLLAHTIVSGELVSHYDQDEWTHLSAIHEQAKNMPQLPMKAESQEPLPSEAYVILDMHRQGIGFKAIAEATKWTEYAVRKLCNQADGKTS